MIFVTVGTEYQFDRMIRRIDEAIGNDQIFDEVFAQIGKGIYEPENMEWVRMLTRDQFDRRIKESRAIVSHAGMGTIIRCLELRKPLLVIPRRSVYGEHVNDHQMATARKFSGREDLLVTNELDDLVSGIQNLESFEPEVSSSSAVRLVSFLRDYLDTLDDSRSGKE